MPAKFEPNKKGLKAFKKQFEKTSNEIISDSLSASKNSSEASAATKLKRDLDKAGIEMSTAETRRLVQQYRAL